MKRFFLILCAVVCGLFCVFELHGDDDLHGDDIHGLFISADLYQSSDVMDYIAIAKFHNVYMLPETGETETNIVSCMKDDRSKITFHIGWYADGFIVTHVNGPNEGHQTVFLGNDIMSADIIGISYPGDRLDHSIIHKYTWGKVCTTMNGQIVIRNNN